MARKKSRGPRVVEQRRPRPAPETAPVVSSAHAPETSAKADQLRELEQIAAARFELERRQFAVVLDARLGGATWTEIGRALGVTPQAVQARYHAKASAGS